MSQALVLNFPIRRALGLPSVPVLSENISMTPMELFLSAIKNQDYAQAIRLISSVKDLQNRTNFIACCVDSAWAFDLLRLVPAARAIPAIIEIAASDTRVARLIAEDLPELTNEFVLRSAINGEESWADRYKLKYNLTATQIKKILSKKAPQRTQSDYDLTL